MSDEPITPWGSAAVLVWTLPGTTPEPDTVPFWRLSDAVEHATETIMNGRHAGKEPWIKVSDTLFGPPDVAAFYRAIQVDRGRE
jgi:hypothetical protein